MKLYHAARSSCSIRVRTAIFLKKISCELILIDLIKKEHLLSNFKNINSAMLVPALELDDGTIVTQSLSILNYFDETYPQNPLWPKDIFLKTNILSFCLTIGMDIQPLNNLRVLNFLLERGFNEENKDLWMRTWIINGFLVLEDTLRKNKGPYCFDNNITMADIFLFPQVLNAERINISLNDFPHIKKRFNFLSNEDSFKRAHPQNWLS